MVPITGPFELVRSPLLLVRMGPPVCYFLSLLCGGELIPSNGRGLSCGGFVRETFNSSVSVIRDLSPFIDAIRLPTLIVSR